jgi:hypothetical protein
LCSNPKESDSFIFPLKLFQPKGPDSFSCRFLRSKRDVEERIPLKNLCPQTKWSLNDSFFKTLSTSYKVMYNTYHTHTTTHTNIMRKLDLQPILTHTEA